MWKGVLFALISAGIIVMGLYSVTHVPLAVQSQKEPLPMEINYDERVKKENARIPSYLQIPSLYLYADIENVEPDDAGRLQKPKDISHISWYAKEEQPLGKKGVIVIAGDFDRENGRPGILYNVSALEKDDVIQVTDLNGKKYNYTVVDKGLYSWDSTDVKTLLIKSQTPRLDLIIYPAYTGGNRDKNESKMIIYAEMK